MHGAVLPIHPVAHIANATVNIALLIYWLLSLFWGLGATVVTSPASEARDLGFGGDK